nr:MAG TPA: hypothetical protein [Caudoviricetes sp.]
MVRDGGHPPTPTLIINLKVHPLWLGTEITAH